MNAASSSAPTCAAQPVVQEILPKAGLVYSEKGNLSEVLCKPKILPIKSTAMAKLEAMEAEAAAAAEGGGGGGGGVEAMVPMPPTGAGSKEDE